jgi:hypothetical protein
MGHFEGFFDSEIMGDYFFWRIKHIMGHFEGFFEGVETFLTPILLSRRGPLKKSLEMPHYVFCPSLSPFPFPFLALILSLSLFGHKDTNIPLILKVLDIVFFCLGQNI